MADNDQFIADVERFVNLTNEKLLRVARQSIDDVARAAQRTVAKGGDMPVDTGTLRNTIVVSLNGSKVAGGAGADDGDASVLLGLSRFEIGDVFTLGWTAEYAVPRHYAVDVGQGGGLWRDKAAQQWESIVERNARRISDL